MWPTAMACRPGAANCRIKRPGWSGNSSRPLPYAFTRRPVTCWRGSQNYALVSGRGLVTRQPAQDGPELQTWQ
jgi:hypothetical protein